MLVCGINPEEMDDVFLMPFKLLEKINCIDLNKDKLGKQYLIFLLYCNTQKKILFMFDLCNL